MFNERRYTVLENPKALKFALRTPMLGFTHDLDYRKIACARGFQSALSNLLLTI